MRVLAFDGRTGASGDMILGSLIDTGAPADALTPVEDALDISYETSRVDRQGITATRVRVTRDGHPIEDAHDTPARTFPETLERIETLPLPDPVLEDAHATFHLLGEAEATVHDTPLEDTHFHEVGTDDAIADIVGVAILIHALAPDRILTTPVATGGGELSMEHGRFPVPPPAVLEIAATASWSIEGGPVDEELLTPTGAAILAHHATGTTHLPPLAVESTGYGAGAKHLPDRPNVLRAITGDTTTTLEKDPIAILQTNLDDATPEVIGGLHDTLADAGARDVSVIPVTMKKSRPGHIITVIVKPEDAERVARRLAAETGTLGVRQLGATHRWIAGRTLETVTLEIDGSPYDIRVKIATDQAGDTIDVSTEYDDAAAVARETGIPVREIMRRAETHHPRDP